MGVINVTPDSFYSGSRNLSIGGVLKMAEAMIREGADILDIGGYSSRPGAAGISEQEESSRVIPAIKAISNHFPDAVLSIDTFRSHIALEAVNQGASIVNDISGGLLDPGMVETSASLKVPYIVMHMKGTPETMKNLTQYDHLINDICFYFSERINQAHSKGIADLILDPGIGFAKSIEQNFEILKNLPYFHIFSLPLLLGISRKSLIYKTLNIEPEDALNGTTILNTLALLHKVSVLRVHDVKEAVELRKLMKIYFR